MKRCQRGDEYSTDGRCTEEAEWGLNILVLVPRNRSLTQLNLERCGDGAGSISPPWTQLGWRSCEVDMRGQ